jgi:site-specific recombinase XerD
MDDYEIYEQACKKIKKVNKHLQNDFEDWLAASDLSAKTIKKHRSNIDFYINEFLLYEEAIHAKSGAGSVDLFLGYWFIRKAMWANQSSIRENAASLKKFYTFMHEKGLIEKDDLMDLKDTIKAQMPEWLATMSRYDDPTVEDVWEM